MLRATLDLLNAGNQVSLRLLKLEEQFEYGRVPEWAANEMYGQLAHETGHTGLALKKFHQVSEVFANRADLTSLLPYGALAKIARLRPTRRELAIAARSTKIYPTIGGDEIAAMIVALR